MAMIPLQKFGEMEFPVTPKSTLNLWAVEGFFRDKGVLAGRIKRIGGRWYVVITSDAVVENAIGQIKNLIAQED